MNDRFLAPNLNLALVYYENGDQEKARFYLEQAEKLAPNLQDEIDVITKSLQQWIYWTEKDKETLEKMFEELK